MLAPNSIFRSFKSNIKIGLFLISIVLILVSVVQHREHIRLFNISYHPKNFLSGFSTYIDPPAGLDMTNHSFLSDSHVCKLNRKSEESRYFDLKNSNKTRGKNYIYKNFIFLPGKIEI